MAGQGVPLPVVRRFQGNLIIGAATGVMRGVQSALKEELTSRVVALGEALEKDRIPDALLESTNLRIATAAQNAIVSGWRSRLPRGSVGSQRKSQSLTGTLGPALGSPQMLAGTSPRVISFVNESFLKQEAIHWYRVNYGVAGPTTGVGHEAGTYTVKFNGRTIMTLRDTNRPAPGGVYLPLSWWWGASGEFLVHRAWKPDPGARPDPRYGARAANFIDLGMEKAAEMIGPEYHEMISNYISTDRGRKRLERAGITVVSDVRLERGGWTVTVT